jgi:hypothetical protein
MTSLPDREPVRDTRATLGMRMPTALFTLAAAIS